MKFTKIKNFTESNEVRIKAVTSKDVIINKLNIYIGGDVYDKYFGDSKSAFVRIMLNDKKEININLSKINIDQKYKEYKFCITGHGTCKTRKLLVSIPDSVTNDLSKYVENRTVFYCTRNDGIIDSLMLNLDTIEKDIKGVFKRSVDNIEVSNKKPKNIKTVRKINKSKSIENNIDHITLDKQFREKFNLDKQERNKLSELYELKEDVDLNNQYRHEELKKLIYRIEEHFDVNKNVQDNILNILTIVFDNYKKENFKNIQARLDFLDKKLSFLSPICTAIDKLDSKIDNITSKNIPDENSSKELSNSIYEKRLREEQLIINLVEHKHKTEERLRELENKVKNIRDIDKRSLFGRIFGE